MTLTKNKIKRWQNINIQNEKVFSTTLVKKKKKIENDEVVNGTQKV